MHIWELFMVWAPDVLEGPDTDEKEIRQKKISSEPPEKF